jgi:hypothetical protein
MNSFENSYGLQGAKFAPVAIYDVSQLIAQNS